MSIQSKHRLSGKIVFAAVHLKFMSAANRPGFKVFLNAIEGEWLKECVDRDSYTGVAQRLESWFFPAGIWFSQWEELADRAMATFSFQ